jgi:tol-pal system protein YbgF
LVAAAEEDCLRLIYAPLLAGISLGCATAAPAGGVPVVHAENGDVVLLRSHSEAQARRITQLEARLGLLEGEAREVRALLQDSPRPDVIRIGAPRDARAVADTPEPIAVAEAPVPRTTERRPLLRSIGEPVIARAPIASPPAPSGVPERLPIAPLPSLDAASSSVAQPTAPVSTPSNDRAREEYRSALTLVRNRDFDAALSALTEFLSKYPNQEFTDRAMFWRAETFYAKRDYERALAEFESLNARFPRGEKVADALLKIGMCHQRLGDELRAQTFFRRVRDQFPESAAARAASKEGA